MRRDALARDVHWSVLPMPVGSSFARLVAWSLVVALQAGSAAADPAPRGGAEPEVRAAAEVDGEFLGAGWFTTAHRIDARWVRGEIRDELGLANLRIDERERARLAHVTIEASEYLRGRGLPIPETTAGDRGANTFLREFVAGERFRDLGPRAMLRATLEVRRLVRRARAEIDHGPRALRRNVTVDGSKANFRFDTRGRVVGWFDPIMPLDGDRLHSIADPRGAW